MAKKNVITCTLNMNVEDEKKESTVKYRAVTRTTLVDTSSSERKPLTYPATFDLEKEPTVAFRCIPYGCGFADPQTGEFGMRVSKRKALILMPNTSSDRTISINRIKYRGGYEVVPVNITCDMWFTDVLTETQVELKPKSERFRQFVPSIEDEAVIQFLEANVNFLNPPEFNLVTDIQDRMRMTTQDREKLNEMVAKVEAAKKDCCFTYKKETPSKELLEGTADTIMCLNFLGQNMDALEFDEVPFVYKLQLLELEKILPDEIAELKRVTQCAAQRILKKHYYREPATSPFRTASDPDRMIDITDDPTVKFLSENKKYIRGANISFVNSIIERGTATNAELNRLKKLMSDIVVEKATGNE